MPRTFSYQDLQKRAEKHMREQHPELQERLWDWVDLQRRSLPHLDVVESMLPKDKFSRNYKVESRDVSALANDIQEKVKSVSPNSSEIIVYLDEDKFEHSLLVHTNSTGEVVGLVEILGGDLAHPALYRSFGVNTVKTTDESQSSLYYGVMTPQLTPQTFLLDGEEIALPIYGLLFLVHEAPSQEAPKGRIALTMWQEHMATTATGDYGLLRTLGQASMRAFTNPNHPIATTVKVFGGEEAFLKAVQNGTYDLAPHTQMDPDKIGLQHNVTPVGITLMPDQAKEVEKLNPNIRFFTPEEIDILITAGIVNGHTIVLIAEDRARNPLFR